MIRIFGVVAVLAMFVPLTTGCGEGGSPSVVEQPAMTPEEAQAKQEAYNASMDADSEAAAADNPDNAAAADNPDK